VQSHPVSVSLRGPARRPGTPTSSDTATQTDTATPGLAGPDMAVSGQEAGGPDTAVSWQHTGTAVQGANRADAGLSIGPQLRPVGTGSMISGGGGTTAAQC